MAVLVTCNIEGDPIENEGARVVTSFSLNLSDTKGKLTP